MDSINFNQLFLHYSNHLRYIAYRYTKDRFLAEDIVQETFIKAYKNISHVKDFRKVKAWLSVITARTAIDFIRSEKRKALTLMEPAAMEPMLASLSFETSTENTVEYRMFHEDLNCKMRLLSSEYQEVLKLRFLYGLKEAEIASILDLKSGTVKTRLYRARKQLKQTLI